MFKEAFDETIAGQNNLFEPNKFSKIALRQFSLRRIAGKQLKSPQIPKKAHGAGALSHRSIGLFSFFCGFQPGRNTDLR